MTEAEILNELKIMLAEHLGLDIAKITPQSTLVDDLGADSLDIAELLISINEKFGYDTPDTEMKKIKKVEDVINLLVANHVVRVSNAK